ncbi:MAG: cell division protein FtsQ/DivIB [Granulosicoccus sp.]
MTAAHSPLIGGRQVLPLAAVRMTAGTRWLVALAGLVVLMGLPVLASHFAQDPARFPVTHVDVLGTMDYADRDALMADIKLHTAQGFYGLDIDRLRQSLESEEWIASARISRVWPSRITIEVEEHEPAARWNDDHLISKRLVLFKPHQLDRQSVAFAQWREVFRPLPQVLGAQGRHVALLDAYRAYDQQVSRFNLNLILLDEDDRLSQTLTLSNGTTVKLGLDERELRMSRFLDVYERLAAKAEEGSLSFDMRYSNGFASSVDTSGVNTSSVDEYPDEN